MFRYKKLSINRKLWHYILVPIGCLLVGILLTINFLFPSTPTTFAESADINQANGGPENSTATLSLGDPITTNGITGETDVGLTDKTQFTVGRGVTAYQSRTVSLTAKHIRNYTIKMYGDDVLASGAKQIKSITTATALGADIAPNSWAYYYGGETLASKNKIAFKPIPTEASLPEDQQLAKASTTSTGSVDNYSQNLIFAANFDADQESGAYKSSNMKVYLTVEPQEYFNYTIKYNAGTGSGTPSTTTQTLGGYDLFSQAFTTATIGTMTKTGYTFKGWNTDSTKASNGEVQFDPGVSITLCSDNSASCSIKDAANKETTLYAVWQVNSYDCVKQYRLQNADESFPSTYTTEATVKVNYGTTCEYSKTEADYKPSATATNGTAVTKSDTMGVNGLILQLDLYRNTFTLTMARNSAIYISSTSPAVGNASSRRWGEPVSISATATSSGKFKNWTQSGTSGTFANADNSSTTFTMGKGDVTVTANGEASEQTMQSFSCSSLSSGSTTTLKDTRDNNTYQVKKMADGNCWMIENLRIVNKTVSSSDSDMTSGSFTIPASASSWTASTDAGSKDVILSGTSGYGAYYNWHVATAGTGSYGSSTAATASICPKGWKLPTNAQFTSLISAVGDANMHTAFSNVLAGYYDTNGSLNVRGSYGYYWSGTVRTTTTAYPMYVGTSTASATNSNKRDGCSIRCVSV